MRRTQKRERQREDHHPNLMFYAMQYYKEQIEKKFYEISATQPSLSSFYITFFYAYNMKELKENHAKADQSTTQYNQFTQENIHTLYHII